MCYLNIVSPNILAKKYSILLKSAVFLTIPRLWSCALLMSYWSCIFQEQSVGSDENKIMDKYLGRIQYFMEVGVRRLCDAVRLSSEKEILR